MDDSRGGAGRRCVHRRGRPRERDGGRRLAAFADRDRDGARRATRRSLHDAVYADALYSVPQADQTARRQPLRIGPVNVDVYEYPPTFLPLPRLMGAATADFWQFRRLWRSTLPVSSSA
jgi:hypothetical protein